MSSLQTRLRTLEAQQDATGFNPAGLAERLKNAREKAQRRQATPDEALAKAHVLASYPDKLAQRLAESLRVFASDKSSSRMGGA